MSSLGIVIIIALFFIVVNHGVITDPNDGMARLWNDLFKNGEYLKHTGPWRNGSIVERVYFEADLRSIEKVVSRTCPVKMMDPLIVAGHKR